MKSGRARTAAATGKAARLAKPLRGRNAAQAAPELVHFGTKVKAVFTIARPKRYASAMLLLFAAAALAAPPEPPPSIIRTGATVQARAMVRIVHAVTVRLGEGPLEGDAPAARRTTVHTDGGPQLASLIEFQ